MALPKYEQIAADLRGRIVRGELRPGDAIPSERELTERWSVARATIVKALEILRQEGLIETRQGTGSTVRDRMALARTAGERYKTSVTTGYIYTAGEHADIVSAERVPAPEDVAAALDVEAGAEVVRRQRVTFEGETPTATSVSWFSAEVAEAAPRLLQRERIREGTTRYVEMQTGRRPHTGRDWWTARLATDAELELLRLDGPAAVSEVRHVAFCQDGRPLTYEVGITPAGRWSRTEEYSMQP
ncbi:GntR family transcriptional regulator [Streptantibioticus cattleyicolor]|uniref:Transcriptional regulator, GntR family n=1 Tax=Streptantibioticus cattleyicolor (strain ATCC 35852 / DSM 46488 / JCM 4925 / NBRC 14057 / NRRL 8057) TaxID=1003195 RepID=F8JN44_STREN|nr:GntR family transcriptional regulator [Streptantibioticus cattleyicolor]AEW99204.1 transcriptional regulator, GntR family [Streptantibioticus cattleyicolor NRRL 8057 = DSM 46488]CCB71752.1 Protein korA [Streptantibioticus cattleyicolor NRRL 8057 = DSM 46488]